MDWHEFSASESGLCRVPGCGLPPAAHSEAGIAGEVRDQAIAVADAHADPTWRAHALDVVQALALRRPEFSTDAVWHALDEEDGPETHERRALGGVMREAARAGWIEPTDRTVDSTRAIAHRGPKRVWRSLICALEG